MIRWPEAYPDVAPAIDLASSGDDPSRHPLFDLSTDRDELLETLHAVAEENLGMAMVFSLVSSLKDSAEALIATRRAEEQARREKAAAEAEAKENERFHGTPVNAETFARWRDAFVKEMEEARIKEEEEKLAEMKKARGKDPSRLTGRQLWERGLAGKVEEGEDEEDDGEGAGMEETAVGVKKLAVKD